MARDKPIILSTKCWIPARNLSPAQLDEIDELFTIEQFELRVCAKCRFEHMRPVEQCYGCKGLKGFTELYTKRQTDDGMYVGIPLAQHRKSLEILELQDVDVIDSRPKIKFPQDLHFTGKLYDGSKPGQADQEGIVEKFWNNVILTKKNAGIIRANPRTGKCLGYHTQIPSSLGILPIGRIYNFASKNTSNGYRVWEARLSSFNADVKCSHIYKSKKEATLNLQFSSGRRLTALPPHRLWAWYGGKFDWIKVEDIHPNDKIYFPRYAANIWPQKPYIFPKFTYEKSKMGSRGLDVTIPKVMSGALAYWLGLLVAEGNCTHNQISFTNANTTLLEMYSCYSDMVFGVTPLRRKQSGDVYGLHLSCLELLSWLKENGISCNRSGNLTVPDCIRMSTKEHQAAFFSAMMDGDGAFYDHVNSDTGSTQPTAEFTSASLDIVDYMSAFLDNLGVEHRIHWRDREDQKRENIWGDVNSYARIHIDHRDSLILNSVLKLQHPEKIKEWNKFIKHVGSGSFSVFDKVPGQEYVDSLWGIIEVGLKALNIYKKDFRKSVGISAKTFHNNRELTYNRLWDILEAIDRFPTPLMQLLNKDGKFKECYNNLKGISTFRYDRVVSNSKGEKEYCYDLVVPNHESYAVAGLMSHNTVITINIILELGYRAVIIAAELAWLEQFCDDFLKLTNVKKLNNAVTLVSNKISSKHYKDVPGICVVKNVEKIPQESCVTLIPYQGFIHDDLKVAKILHGNYTTLGVDECHQAGAFEYSRLLNNLDVTYRISVSATVDRNDGMSPVVKRLLGNVAVISDDIVMIPELHIVETNISVNSSTHTGRVTSISKNNPRNLIILKTLFDDLKENKDHCLFVAVERVHQMLKLTNMINQQAAHDNAVAREKDEPEPWLFPLALSYSGATYDHKHVRQQATDKAIRVVVAVSKKVKHGISVPAWTHCYITYPIADGPGFYQITQRVCTTYENKPQPHIRVFIDASPDSAKTFRNLYTSPYNSLKSLIEKGVMKVSPETHVRLSYIVSHADSYFGSGKASDMGRKRVNKVGGFAGISKRR